MMNTGSYCAKIYNGSDWHLTRVVISLKYVEENGAVKWQRDYSIYPTGYIRPLTTETDFVTVGEYVSSSQKEEPLNIKEVYGVKR